MFARCTCLLVWSQYFPPYSSFSSRRGARVFLFLFPKTNGICPLRTSSIFLLYLLASQLWRRCLPPKNGQTLRQPSRHSIWLCLVHKLTSLPPIMKCPSANFSPLPTDLVSYGVGVCPLKKVKPYASPQGKLSASLALDSIHKLPFRHPGAYAAPGSGATHLPTWYREWLASRAPGAMIVGVKLANLEWLAHSGGNDRFCARLKTDILAFSSGLQGHLRSCLTI
jgi:hypothetical protein